MTTPLAVRVLHFIGSFWYGAVLVALIVGQILHPVRDVVASLGFGTYISLWLVLMIPGVVALLIAERMRARA
jgi:hypothetical protein